MNTEWPWEMCLDLLYDYYMNILFANILYFIKEYEPDDLESISP